MIQARPTENGDPFGTFRLLPTDEKSKLFGCPIITEFVRILPVIKKKLILMMFMIIIIHRILLLIKILIQWNQ